MQKLYILTYQGELRYFSNLKKAWAQYVEIKISQSEKPVGYPAALAQISRKNMFLGHILATGNGLLIKKVLIE